MRCALVPLLVALVAAPAAAQGPGEAFLRVCGDPGVSAREAARTCAKALEAGDLGPGQRAAAALNLGGAMIELGRPAEAIAAYDRALAERPGWAAAHAARGEARAARGDLAGASADWEAAVAAAPQDPAMRAGRGAQRLRAGDAEGALADLDAARARLRDDPLVAFNRGLALGALGRDGEAEAAFSAVIAANPEDAAAYLNRGRVRAGRDRAAALADLDRAVGLAGDWTQPLVERGALLDAMGRTAEADRDFRRAFELGHRSEALNARVQGIGN